jgi:FG-GAP repeat
MAVVEPSNPARPLTIAVVLAASLVVSSPVASGQSNASWFPAREVRGRLQSAPPGWFGEGDQELASFGISVAGAGDVNGDGFGDLVIGADLYGFQQADGGGAFAYYGSPAGLPISPDWIGEGHQTDARFGHAVAGAGDVNGDGYGDVVVGAYRFDDTYLSEGQADVYYGSAGGLSHTPNWAETSGQIVAEFGISVAGAGDVNGDGFGDVLIGATGYTHGQSGEGGAFLYFGSAGGLPDNPDWIGESNQLSGSFGISVAGAGDVNGDGFDDVIVGADYYSHGEEFEGRAFLYYGSATGPSHTPDWAAESNQYHAYLGHSVAGAGDVNGDGYDDVVLGTYQFDHGQNNEGKAFVYYGSPAGPSASPDWTAEGDQIGSYFGIAVAGAGDVDGDGYGDLMVGSDRYSHGQTDEGRAFIFCGSATGLETSPCLRLESGQDEANLGLSVSSAGDVDGDGYGDVVAGAPFYDDPQVDEGLAVLRYGKPR